MIAYHPEKKPSVLVPDGRTDHGVESCQMDRSLVRVIPQTARDVFGLQMLDQHREKWAPANGPGIMVTPEALAKVTSIRRP